MAELKLTAQPRTLAGRKVRQLRNQGLLPVVIYGPKQDKAVSLQIETRAFERVLHAAGFSQLVQIDVDGGSTHNVLIREVQQHPVTHHPLHVDFYAVDLTVKQQINVPVHGVGKPTALAVGLMVLQSLDHVTVEALPADIPTHIDLDITELSLENHLTIAALPQIPGVTYVNDPEEAIFTMIATRAEEEAADDAEGGAEPEVIAKGKEEDEE